MREAWTTCSGFALVCCGHLYSPSLAAAAAVVIQHTKVCEAESHIGTLNSRLFDFLTLGKRFHFCLVFQHGGWKGVPLVVFHCLAAAGERLGTGSSRAAVSERNSGRLLHQVMICLFAIYGARRRLWVIGIWRLVNKRRQGWNSNSKKASLGLKKTTI